jgi:acyl carrier protein
MATDRKEILKQILDSVQSVVEENPDLDQTRFEEDSDLFGGDSTLDSLMLVSFVVELEKKIENVYGVYLALADERAMSAPVNPFKTVSTLADYIQLRLSENGAP